MAVNVTQHHFFLPSLPPTDAERRLAWAVVILLAVIFCAAIPFAKVPLARFPVFIAIYQSILVVGDLLTAVLLFGNAAILRSRTLLILAGGYLFSGAMATVHMLTFPGLFAAEGLLGAGTQSTAWLYMFWHAGFPLAIIAFNHLENRPLAWPPGTAILASISIVLGLTTGFVLLTTTGAALLPPIMQGSSYTPAMVFVVGTVWLLTFAALIAAWRHRSRSVLDLWLMVAACTWLFDVALSAVFNGGRFDLGFYAGRISGLLSSSFVLIVLLSHTLKLYSQLAQSAAELERSNQELDEFAYVASHDLKEPLRGIHNYASFLQEDYSDKLDGEGRGFLERIQRLAERQTTLIDRLLAYSRIGSTEMATEPADLDKILDQVVEDLKPLLEAERVELRRLSRLPTAVCNPLRVGEVLQNLIANATKYNDKPQRWVEVGCDTAAKPPVFHVRDNGIGIAPQHQDSVFRIFKRLHEQSKFGGGTGAGLTIVKKIVERHGGRIWLQSAPGEGTTFYFTLTGPA
jgi:two-component system sensor histidine kinase/response regulator